MNCLFEMTCVNAWSVGECVILTIRVNWGRTLRRIQSSVRDLVEKSLGTKCRDPWDGMHKCCCYCIYTLEVFAFCFVLCFSTLLFSESFRESSVTMYHVKALGGHFEWCFNFVFSQHSRISQVFSYWQIVQETDDGLDIRLFLQIKWKYKFSVDVYGTHA